jgi:pimeloyl-ACP methyl ester carboxylesterase
VNERWIETRRGLRIRVFERGESGSALVWLHGEAGMLQSEPLLERLAERHRVIAPEWPGYGETRGEEHLEDMLDFALHGWDVIEALELDAPPVLAGHSMGGMIAAEMACLAPRSLERLVLISALGLWIDSHPIPDLFATLPFDVPALLFHDAAQGVAALTGGVDFSSMEALQQFLIGNARRLGTAGKILFPIPNRRVIRRLYRITTPALVLWGREDRFTPLLYAERWQALLPLARCEVIGSAGHMLPYEKPDAAAEAVEKFLAA